MIKKLFWIVCILCLLTALAGGSALYYLIVLHPGEEIKEGNINSILGKESPVFYSDGKTRLGVFFDEAHRQYVPYEKIPVNFINALVASEDNRFFSHFGFDVLGIARAAIKNIQSRRIVQGGSTLTQQTAKNLFKRENRSYRAKMKELLFALRLEYHYSKEKIFEFYANQFYVSGNGHGLGVAARYYFNKKPQELTLHECAYIAGSVKRPNYYNPFLKKSDEGAERALKRGKGRVGYVLEKMMKLGMISEYQYSLAKVSDVQFKKGQVGYSLDYAMEMVKDAVTSTQITDALEQHDIDNIATSGVRIITTVNRNLQDETLYALRRQLSVLDVRLRGYEREEVQKELMSLKYTGDVMSSNHAFLFGVVRNISADPASPLVEVDFGRRLGSGIIEKEGLRRMVEARVKWQKNPWAVTGDKDYARFLDQLLQGDKVWVSVNGRGDDGRLLLHLEKFPEVNGGALVLKDGRIEAVAGGVENRFYNRAIYAKRTMGSSFKPFVFSAAMQLGWNSGDNLMNSRDVFLFQNQAYFPRPDHHSPHSEVSMSWAGVHSENVASVWLLANLCRKMDSEQFREVAFNVGMAPMILDGEQEPYSRFSSRIRDKFGIRLNRNVLRKAAFEQALKNVETDLIFVGRDVDYARFQKMHYGLRFDEFREEIRTELWGKSQGLSAGMKKELRLRLKILQNNFLDLEVLRKQLQQYILFFDSGQPDYFFRQTISSNGEEKGSRSAALYYDSFTQQYSFVDVNSHSQGVTAVNTEDLRKYLDGLEGNGKDQFWKDVLLRGDVSVESFDIVQKQIDRELDRLKTKLPYSMDVLESVSDYRVMVGLKFLVSFARELGIHSELEPVLSFPLGSNVVTLMETLRMYEALVTGEITHTSWEKEDNGDLLSIIDRIESDEGELLFEPHRITKRVIDKKTSMAVGHILENTIKYGTGRYADKNIKLTDGDTGGTKGEVDNLELSVPVLGKTGTANRYTNASFFGFLPLLAPKHDGVTMEDGYAVGVYVGFDDNKEMRKKATRIAGSAGALPPWTDIVNSLIQEKDYVKHLDPVDLSFNGLILMREKIGQKNIVVADETGGVVSSAREINQQDRYQPSILTFGDIDPNGSFIPERQFLPFWRISSQGNSVSQ